MWLREKVTQMTQLDVRKCSLDAQEVKSISLLDNVAILVHFLFAEYTYLL